jgi:hypothetical protein
VENVDAVMTWMNSEGHKANILSAKTTMFGCAYTYNADSTYKHYWTQRTSATAARGHTRRELVELDSTLHIVDSNLPSVGSAAKAHKKQL